MWLREVTFLLNIIESASFFTMPAPMNKIWPDRFHYIFNGKKTRVRRDIKKLDINFFLT